MRSTEVLLLTMTASFPVSDIKRAIDAMSWVKASRSFPQTYVFFLITSSCQQINQFHWHIVDSQSFPLQVPGFPELSQKGAYSSSMVYSASDVKDIVSYAGAVSRMNF